jgi:hypothetical protein
LSPILVCLDLRVAGLHQVKFRTFPEFVDQACLDPYPSASGCLINGFVIDFQRRDIFFREVNGQFMGEAIADPQSLSRQLHADCDASFHTWAIVPTGI